MARPLGRVLPFVEALAVFVLVSAVVPDETLGAVVVVVPDVATEAVVTALMAVLVDVEGTITTLVLPDPVASLDWVGVMSG